MKRNEIIADIGKQLIDDLYKLNDTFERDFCDESGTRSYSFRTRITYEYGGKEYEVQVWADWPHVGENTLEVEITGGCGKNGHWKYYDSLQQAIVAYLRTNLSMNELLSSLLEQMRDNTYDEWDDHGFRDEADYNNWRYGRSR